MNLPTKDLNITRKSFVEQAGLKSLEDIGHLKEPDLVEMCNLFPRPMAQLIVELAGMYRISEQRIKMLNKQLEAKTGVHEAGSRAM